MRASDAQGASGLLHLTRAHYQHAHASAVQMLQLTQIDHQFAATLGDFFADRVLYLGQPIAEREASLKLEHRDSRINAPHLDVKDHGATITDLARTDLASP